MSADAPAPEGADPLAALRPVALPVVDIGVEFDSNDPTHVIFLLRWRNGKFPDQTVRVSPELADSMAGHIIAVTNACRDAAAGRPIIAHAPNLKRFRELAEKAQADLVEAITDGIASPSLPGMLLVSTTALAVRVQSRLKRLADALGVRSPDPQPPKEDA